MRVYHGSYLKIFQIDLSKCEPRKNFSELSNLKTDFYQKSWQGVYELLKQEYRDMTR
jgi:hypothetical protein